MQDAPATHSAEASGREEGHGLVTRVPGASAPGPRLPAAWRAWLPLLVMVGTFIVVVPLVVAAPGAADVPATPSSAMSTEIVRLGLAGLISLGSGVVTLFVGRREYTVEISEVKRRLDRIENIASPRDLTTSLESRVSRQEDQTREDVGELHRKINLVSEGLAAVETEQRTISGLVTSIARKMKLIP